MAFTYPKYKNKAASYRIGRIVKVSKFTQPVLVYYPHRKGVKNSHLRPFQVVFHGLADIWWYGNASSLLQHHRIRYHNRDRYCIFAIWAYQNSQHSLIHKQSKTTEGGRDIHRYEDVSKNRKRQEVTSLEEKIT